MERENAWKTYGEKEKKELDELNKGYIEFLSTGKTERECVKEIIRQAEESGYRNLDDVIKEGKKPEKGGYFDDTISKRVPKFLWIMIIILGSIGVLAIICVFPYKEEIQENETPIVKEEHTDSAEQISSKDENNNSSKSDQPILRAICSCQFLTLCFFTGLTFCKCTKLNNY